MSTRTARILKVAQASCSLTAMMLALKTLPVSAQETQYSASAEYRQMLEELARPSPSPAFLATGQRLGPAKSLAVVAKDAPTRLVISTAMADFTLEKATRKLSWHDRKTGAGWQLAIAPVCKKEESSPLQNFGPVTRDGNVWSVSYSSACGGTTLSLSLLAEDMARVEVEAKAAPELQLHVEGGGPFFGLGERFWQAGLSGTHLDVRPLDHYGEPGHNWTYVAIPFVYTPGGLGLYADTAFDTRFVCNEADSSFDMHIAHPNASFYLFTEPTPKEVIRAYTAVTGRPENPPLWTFGPWITTLQGKGSVLQAVGRIRSEAIPASALWIYDELDEENNLGWPFWFGSFYGDERAFTDTLHGMGFRVLTYVHPYVRQQMMPYSLTSPTWEKGVRDKLLMTDSAGQPAGPRFEPVKTGNIDFTNPAAVDWWQAMITGAVQGAGFDGWMEDFGEWVRDSDRFAAGNGTKMSELYPLLYHKVTIRVAQAINPEVTPFSRSGAPGSQAFSPVLWGGDQSANWSRDYGLPSVVTAGITAGMSGFSTWGPDILSTGSSEELWTRWVEFGALTPVMRDHVWDKPEHSINLFSTAATTATFRRYAALHTSLLPYFATYAAEAHQTGVPIMRHTALEFPDDPRSATAEYQYLLGHEILVAPVVEPAGERKLYLPKGEWINFWNGDSFTGGQDVTVAAPVDTIPMLVRAGSVLPFLPEAGTASLNWSDPHLLSGPLVWRGFLSATGSARGSFQMPNGTSASLQQADGSVTIKGDSESPRAYEVVVRSKLEPTQVLLNGAPLTNREHPKPQPAVTQWWWDPSTAEVHVVLHGSRFSVEMQGVTAAQYTN